MKTISKLLLFALFFAILPAFLSAQADRGGISGRITDNSGAVVPFTKVVLRNEATGVIQTSVTNSDGVYTFQNLNPGSYDITVDRQGFKKAEHSHTVVDVNQVNQQDIALQVGGNNEVVEVTTGVQQLQTTSGSIGLVVEEKSIQELPLIYGNPFTLETLAPGILPSGVNPNIHTYDSSTASVSVNGSVLNSIEYELDGAPDNRIRLSAYTPSTEFINQYRVESASYDATEGHSSGGFVNVSLKTGTSAFHGSAFAYYQNPTLNANPWSLKGSASKPVWLREGVDVSGPIWKDKAFFFAGYEHSRAANANVQTLTVPTLAERSGDFSALYAADTNPKDPATGPGNAYQIYDPNSGHTVPGSTAVVRNAFSGNIIPSVTPIAKQLLSYYPKPNEPGNVDGSSNFAYAGSEGDYYYSYAGRVDYNPTSKQNIFGHLVDSRRLQPGKNAYFTPVSGTNLTYINHGVAFGYTYALTPATLVEAHLTWTRFDNQNTLPSQGKLNATTVGMPSYLIDGLPSAANAFPRIDITGFTSLNSDNSVVSHDDVTLGRVQISHLLGNHFLRTGFEYRMYNTNGSVGTQSNGDYSSSGAYATANSLTKAPAIGLSLAELESGILDSSKITIQSDFASRSNYMAGWLMDDWKAQPNLTLNIGLRYEYEGPNSERYNKANTYFDFGAVNPVAAAAQANYLAEHQTNPLLPATLAVNGGLRFAGENGAGKQVYHSQVLNLMPRLGLSYRIGQNTVLHAGFGIFDDSLTTFYMSGGNSGSTSTFLLPQQGFSAATSQNGTTDAGLTFPSNLADPFPNGIAQPSGNSLGLSTFLGNSVTFQTPNPKVPYNIRWSGGVQHQFGAWLSEIDYVGNHGLHLPVNQQYNALPAQYLSTVTTGFDMVENTKLAPTVSNPFYKVIPNTASLGSSKTTGLTQLLLPYPEFTGVSAYVDTATSTYHSLQISLLRRFTGGASLTSAFTWSKTMDSTQFLNPSDTHGWYGISPNDRTFRLATSGIYQLPFGTGRRFLTGNRIVSAIVGGWQAQGVYQVQSGQPLNFKQESTSPVYNGANPAASAWGRAAYKKSIPGPGKSGYWFNTANWVKNTSTTGCSATTTSCAGVLPGSRQLRVFPIGFDGLRADFLNQFDAGVQRNFTIYRESQLQFRVEAINVLNHPVYSAPNTDWTNASFGQITSQANQPRVWQFVAIVRF